MANLFVLTLLLAAGPADTAARVETYRTLFTLCPRGPRSSDCVVDGDTFWLAGEKIRIADIDTPETFQPRCPDEAARGAAAKMLLLRLLNAGSFSLVPADRETDRYGRKLRIVSRRGHSVGGQMVDQGLARWYGGARRGWC